MLGLIKRRCGIAESVHAYDDDITAYMADCRQDMVASGVLRHIAEAEDRADVQTAITLYVNAYLGNDRADTEKYLELYRKKVFRLTLEGMEDVE